MKKYRNWLAMLWVLAVFFFPHQAVAGPYKQVKDWHVTCSNALTCTMSTYSGDRQIYSFGFERGPEANAPVTIVLSTGLTINEESDIVIRVDGGEPIVYLEIPKADFKEGTWRFPGQDSEKRLLAAMMEGRTMSLAIEAAEGDGEHPIPLSGVTAAALFMDEAQGRVGNRDALKATGAGEPKIATSRVKELTSRLQLPKSVQRLWQAEPDQCAEGSEPGDDLISNYGGTAVALENQATLYILPCGLPGAYNLPQVVLIHSGETQSARKMFLPVMGRRGPTLIDYTYNTSWDDRESELSAFYKGRGLGDCGGRQVWHIEGGYDANFELIEERLKDDCDGKYDDWPLIWPLN